MLGGYKYLGVATAAVAPLTWGASDIPGHCRSPTRIVVVMMIVVVTMIGDVMMRGDVTMRVVGMIRTVAMRTYQSSILSVEKALVVVVVAVAPLPPPPAADGKDPT